MSGRYAKLKSNWMLRGWSDMPRMLINWTTSDQRDLKTTGFYVAEGCDGQTNFDSFAFLPQHHAVLDKLIEVGIAEACPEGDSIAPWQRYRKADNPRLTGIHWCVTGRCNLNCRHCYMQSPARRYGELPFEDMARLVEQFVQANVIEVSLTGGEPFVRKDLLDLIQLLTQKRIRLNQIYSNGLLITDEHLKAIRRTGSSPSFQISFDGVGGHDRMRGTKGVEQGVLDAIRRLRAAGFPVVVATSIDKLNIRRLAATYDLMKELGVQSWRIAAPQETGNWRGTTTASSLHENAEACAPLLNRWLKDGKPFAIQLGGFFRGGPSRKGGTPGRSPVRMQDTLRARSSAPGSKSPGAAEDTRNYTPDSYDCGACREQPNLLPDGTLVPCPGYVDSVLHERMPNLLREPLSKVWTHSFLRQIADMRKKDLLARNPECAACEMFKECGAGCRASALTETGELMAKDPVTCDLWKKGYRKRFREMAASAL